MPSKKASLLLVKDDVDQYSKCILAKARNSKRAIYMPIVGERPSISVKTILLAIDFNAASASAAGYAKALAKRFSSTVDIVHVVDPVSASSHGEAWVNIPNIDERRKISSENLIRLQEDFKLIGLEARTVSSDGSSPALELLRIAKEQGAELIVAGTQSKPAIEKLLLGSTTEQLIRSASCPVFTVGPHIKQVGDSPLVFQNIVYATDLTPEATKAAVYALSFAEDSGAHLYYCYVLGSAIPDFDRRIVVEQACKSALKRMIPESSYDWCSPESVVEHGDAAGVILALAERVKADLIVLGARKASFWLTHVEHTMTSQLLAEATCPVMSIC